MADYLIQLAEVLPEEMAIQAAAEIVRSAFELPPAASVVAVHLLVDGTDAEIGARLRVTASTVKKHKERILRAVRRHSCRAAAIVIFQAIQSR